MDSIERRVTIHTDAQGPLATIRFSSQAGVVSLTVDCGTNAGRQRSIGYSNAAGLRELASELVSLAEFTEQAE